MIGNLFGTLFSFIALFTLFILPVVLIIFLFKRSNKRRGREEEVLNKLPSEAQKAERNKKNEEVINFFTVILPFAIMGVLIEIDNMPFLYAFIIGIFVSLLFRLLIYFAKKRR